MKILDKYRGCLVGGAAGDALGYAIEFLDATSILKKYGTNGITKYNLSNGIAEISDDTQMTLFTANGLLFAATRGKTRGIMATYPYYINLCYKDWLQTQNEQFPLNVSFWNSWLVNVPELFHRRAPGNTCLSAIGSTQYGTIKKPINKSKGCGGIMRVAPIGLYFKGKHRSIEEIDKIGAETAALTHGHELGYIPAAALVHIIQLIAHSDKITLLNAVLDMRKTISSLFDGAKHLQKQLNLIDKAIELSQRSTHDMEAIEELGQGWTAEETLAIALYCSLKYSTDFDKALIASVNHSGDSDSTGAVTGNILGAYLGIKDIPEKYLEHLELKNIMLELADDLYHDCKITEYGSYKDEVWEQKYIYKTYQPVKLLCQTKETASNVIVFPEFQRLKDNVKKLRIELSKILLERDELQFVICKNIEAQYMLKFGSLEYKTYETQCTILRLKRKIELIQAKINRQEKIVLPKIEETLDNEFAQYQQLLDEQINKMNEIMERSRAKALSGEANKTFKKTYRDIIKALHPDLNPNITEAQLRLFNNAVTAYKNGDLEMLVRIKEMISITEEPEDSMSQLAKEKERLTGKIKIIQNDIEKIKSEYPYSIKIIIEDPDKIEQRTIKLKQILSQYDEIIDNLKKRIEEMLR